MYICLFETFLALRRIQQDTNLCRSSCKMMVIFAQFSQVWVLVDCNTNTAIPNFTKICPVGVQCSVQTEGHTYNVTDSYFHNFVNAPQNGLGKSTGRLQMERKQACTEC
jgi:hypothetical protein